MSELRKALDNLEEICPHFHFPGDQELLDESIAEIRQALAQQKQEPVAWVDAKPDGYDFWGLREVPFGKHYLYTAPPSIEAAVLAEREACAKVCDAADKSTHPAELADAIRARGEK